MATYEQFAAVFSPLIEIKEKETQMVPTNREINAALSKRWGGPCFGHHYYCKDHWGNEKENNMELQYKNETIESIQQVPTKQSGLFSWRVFCVSKNMYSKCFETFDVALTPLKDISAGHTVKIGYTTRIWQNKTYYNLESIERFIQQDVPETLPEEPVAIDAPLESLLEEPEFIQDAEDTNVPLPTTEPQTMMADPVTRGNWGIAIFEMYEKHGLIKAKLTKAEKELEDAIMAKAYGVINAMDSIGE